MSDNRPGRVERVTAGVDTPHKAAAADNGFVGVAIKTLTPSQDTARSARATILAGEQYNLLLTGIIEVPNTDISGAVKGDLIYITSATNALSTAAGGGKQILGKVAAVAGENGTPTGIAKINLNEKVA